MSGVRLGMMAAAAAAIAWTAVRALDRSDTPTLAAVEATSQRRAGPDSARIASLLSALASGDPLVCEIVASQAGNVWWGGHTRAVGRFADARVDQAAAADSLSGRITAPGAMRFLTATLAHENACVRRLAARLLGRSAIETSALSALLDDPSPRVREAAAYAIGAGDKRSARAALERMLTQRGAAEAAMAAWALAEEQDPASLPPLQQALRHDDPRVRRSAAYALGEIADVRALSALSAAVRDPDAEVRYAAVAAIGELDGLERAPDALIDAAQSRDAELVRLAALVLADLHDTATLTLLLTLSETPDRDVRRQVAEALGAIGSAKANAVLTRLLKDADADVRRAAAEALGDIRENASNDRPADSP